MSFADKTLTCRDCGEAFTFTSGEQDFYAQKGFANEPTRCPNCRQARKSSRGGDSYGGGRDSYSSGGYGGGGSSYSSGGSRGGYDRAPREMYTTTCSSCGKEAQVPFVPRGDKPVYCADCFEQQRPARNDNRSRW